MAQPGNTTNGAAQALAAAQVRFNANHPASKAQHELATTCMPGGNTRTLLHTSPFPLAMTRGEGVFIHDSDGHKYSLFPRSYHSQLTPHHLVCQISRPDR